MCSHPVEEPVPIFLPSVTILAEIQLGKLDFNSSSVVWGGICPTNIVFGEASLLKTEMKLF